MIKGEFIRLLVFLTRFCISISDFLRGTFDENFLINICNCQNILRYESD